jgi:flagellar hook-associated protein 3 FlgL
MRITHTMVSDSSLRNMRNNLERLDTLNNQISTGKRVSRPSEDPAGTARTLTYNTDIANGETYLRTMDAAVTWLNATDDALAEAGTLLQRARELAVQGANGSLTPNDMATIGAEVDHILSQMLVTGNASLRGQRLFAGELINADPFTPAGGAPGYTYSGDTGTMEREYDLGAYVTINTPGQVTIGPAITALFNLRNNLNAGNGAAVSAGDLTAIDSAIDTILAARADIGAKTNRLEVAADRQSLLQVNLHDLRSKVEDVDLVEAISKFSVRETVYKASLEVSGKAIQPSLLDYLR